MSRQTGRRKIRNFKYFLFFNIISLIFASDFDSHGIRAKQHTDPNRITTERRARWISGAVFFVLIRRALATVRRRAEKQQAGAAGNGASFCRKIARGAGSGKTERRDVIPT